LACVLGTPIIPLRTGLGIRLPVHAIHGGDKFSPVDDVSEREKQGRRWPVQSLLIRLTLSVFRVIVWTSATRTPGEVKARSRS